MIVIDGYIIATETTDAQYDAIIEKIHDMPDAPEGSMYRLRADTLEWELVELPPAPPPSPDDELSDTEALSLITGGTI